MSRTAEYKGDRSSIHPRNAVTSLERGWIRFSRRHGVLPIGADLGVLVVTKIKSAEEIEDPVDTGPIDFNRARQLRRGLEAASEVVQTIASTS